MKRENILLKCKIRVKYDVFDTIFAFMEKLFGESVYNLKKKSYLCGLFIN